MGLKSRMNKLGALHSAQQELKRKRRNNQLQAQNYAVEQAQAKRRAQKAIRTNRQIQKQVGNSNFGRALMGAVYGFNTNMSPLSYSKKASDLGYKSYTPTAAAKERGDTSKRTAEFNKGLESSKAYKGGHLAGNALATMASFLLGGGATKAVAGKAMQTGAAKSASKWASSKLASKALRAEASKKLSDKLVNKVLTRSAQNAGRAVTSNAIKSASSKITNRVMENALQDVAGDATIGLYRDLATAREQGVDVKNIKQLAPYLAKQAGWNTVLGGITNAGGPAISALRRNKKMWKTVEDTVTDATGRVHVRYKKVLKNPAKGALAIDRLGNNIDVVSPKVKATSKAQKLTKKIGENTQVRTPADLKRKAVADAVNNDWYVSEIRRKGINGKSVRQLADEQHRSVMDIISEDYQKRYGRTIRQNRALNKARPTITRDIDTQLSATNINGTRAVNRGKLKAVYNTADPFGNAGNIKAKSVRGRTGLVRNAQGRLVAHKATSADVMRANALAVEGAPDIISARRASLATRRSADDVVANAASNAGTYKSNYVPTYDIDDVDLARKLEQSKVEKYIKSKYGKDYIEYAEENNLEPSAVIMMGRDEMAGRLGARKLTASEQDAFRNVKDEIQESASKRFNKVTKGLPDDVKAKDIADEGIPKNYTDNDYINDMKTVTGSDATKAERLSAQQRIDDYNARQASQTATEGEQVVEPSIANAQKETATDTATNTAKGNNDNIDVTMGGSRSGVAKQQSEAVESVAGAGKTTKAEREEIKKSLADMNADRTFHQSNEDALNEAIERIDRDGIDESRVALRQAFDGNRRFGNVEVAEGYTLQTKYNDMARTAKANGNMAKAKEYYAKRDEVGAIIAMEASENAKATQAMNIYKKMTPEGRVNAVLMMQAKIQKETGVKKLKLNQKLLDMLYDAKRTQDMQVIQDAIKVDLWNQVPSTLTEKCAAWRYMSMLMNPKTHIRNIFGNGVFVPTRGIKNILGAGIEKAFVKSGNRSKAILNPLSQVDRRYVNKGIQEWDKVRDSFLNGTTKYDVGLRRPEGANVFKTKLLNKASDLNSIALNKEDEVFAKYAYSHAYAQYLKANKIDIASASEDVLEKARRQAWDEALTATYREDNAIAELINKGRRYANITMRDLKNAKGTKLQKLLLAKAGGTAVDAMIPFAKTPANILTSGINYSPVGIVRGVAKLLTASNPEQTIKGIDALSQGLTGSGMFALGILLAHNKIANASIDLDDQGYYDYDRGKQEYAISTNKLKQGIYDLGSKINIGDVSLSKFDWFNQLNANRGQDYSVSMDWAVPDAMSFFSGVEAYNTFATPKDDEDDITDTATRVGKFFTNALKMSDPVLEMSMLSSLKNAFDNSSAGENGNSPLLQSMINVTQSRLGQYVPTALGQATKTMEQNQKSSSSVVDGSMRTWDKFLKQQENKIPFLTKLNPDKTDAFGNVKEHKETPKDYLTAYLKNAVSPANIKAVRNNNVDKELQRLVKEGQAPKDVLPRTAYKGMMDSEFGDIKFKIGAKEVEQFNKFRGNAAMKNLTALFKTERYKNASTEDKAKLVKDAYDTATDIAKKKFAGTQGISGYKYDYGILSDSAKEKYNDKLKELKKAGSSMKKKAYIKIFTECYGYGSDYPDIDDNGKYVAKTMHAINIKGGVRNLDEAKITTNANATTYTKAVNIYNRGIKEDAVLKHTLTPEQKEKLSYETKAGQLRLDPAKFTDYINSKKISQNEKWLWFEVNRYGGKGWTNPF